MFFSSLLLLCHSHESRVIFLQERRLGSSQIDHGTLGFRASGTPLRVDLEDRESGFTERQEVPYRRIWTSSKISIRRSFRIEKVVADLRLAFELRVSQRGFEDQSLLLKIDLDLVKRNNMSGKRNGNKTESSVVLRGKSSTRSTESVIPRPFRCALLFRATRNSFAIKIRDSLLDVALIAQRIEKHFNYAASSSFRLYQR